MRQGSQSGPSRKTGASAGGCMRDSCSDIRSIAVADVHNCSASRKNTKLGPSYYRSLLGFAKPLTKHRNGLGPGRACLRLLFQFQFLDFFSQDLTCVFNVNCRRRFHLDFNSTLLAEGRIDPTERTRLVQSRIRRRNNMVIRQHTKPRRSQSVTDRFHGQIQAEGSGI